MATHSISSDIHNVSNKYDDFIEDENDDLEDDWDEELVDLHQEENPSFMVPSEKSTVKFREDRNVTIDITPRNLGYKVADLENHTKKKHSAPKNVDELQSLLSVKHTGPRKSHITVSDVSHKTKKSLDLNSSQQSNENLKPTSSALKSCDSKCEKRLTQERPKSASKPSNPVAMVTVAYSDVEDVKKASTKSKTSRKKGVDKDVITMVQTMADSENEIQVVAGSEEEITPDKLEPWMPTKCVSEAPKNYYELSRRSASVQSHVREPSPPTSAQVYKTTKTLEFDEYKPKETSIKSLIDNNSLLKSRERDRFVGLGEDNRAKVRPSSEHPPHLAPNDRPTNRPRSAMVCCFFVCRNEKH